MSYNLDLFCLSDYRDRFILRLVEHVYLKGDAVPRVLKEQRIASGDNDDRRISRG